MMGNKTMRKQLIRLEEQLCEVIATARTEQEAEVERYKKRMTHLQHIVESARRANQQLQMARDWTVIEGGRGESDEPLRAA